MVKFFVLILSGLLVGCGDPVIHAQMRGHDAGVRSTDPRCLAELPRPQTFMMWRAHDETKETLTAYREAYLAACRRKHSGREARGTDTWEQNVESE